MPEYQVEANQTQAAQPVTALSQGTITQPEQLDWPHPVALQANSHLLVFS